MDIDEISQIIENIPATNQAGSLAFFGGWFGMLPDNIHRLTSVDVEGNALMMGFHKGEQLEICDPSELEIMDDALIIWSASSINWEWNSYGEIPSPNNRYHHKFQSLQDRVLLSTNFGHPMVPCKDEPAFEMAWYIHPEMSHRPYHRMRGCLRLP